MHWRATKRLLRKTLRRPSERLSYMRPLYGSPPYERRLVVLTCLEETPWRRIAEEFHKPVPTVYGHYRKALEKVRAELTGQPMPRARKRS